MRLCILFLSESKRNRKQTRHPNPTRLHHKPTANCVRKHVRTGWPKARGKSQRGKERDIRRVWEGAKQATQIFNTKQTPFASSFFCFRRNQQTTLYTQHTNPPYFLSSSALFLVVFLAQFEKELNFVVEDQFI